MKKYEVRAEAKVVCVKIIEAENLGNALHVADNIETKEWMDGHADVDTFYIKSIKDYE